MRIIQICHIPQDRRNNEPERMIALTDDGRVWERWMSSCEWTRWIGINTGFITATKPNVEPNGGPTPVPDRG
jgi:hypothetical protein